MMLQPTHQMPLWLSPVLDASPPDKIRQPSTGKRSNRPLPVVKSSLASRRRLLKAAVECKEKFRRSHLSGDTRESLCWEGRRPLVAPVSGDSRDFLCWDRHRPSLQRSPITDCSSSYGECSIVRLNLLCWAMTEPSLRPSTAFLPPTLIISASITRNVRFFNALFSRCHCLWHLK